MLPTTVRAHDELLAAERRRRRCVEELRACRRRAARDRRRGSASRSARRGARRRRSRGVVDSAVAERHAVAVEVDQLPAGDARVAAVLGRGERGLGDELDERVAERRSSAGEERRRAVASSVSSGSPRAPSPARRRLDEVAQADDGAEDGVVRPAAGDAASSRRGAAATRARRRDRAATDVAKSFGGNSSTARRSSSANGCAPRTDRPRGSGGVGSNAVSSASMYVDGAERGAAGLSSGGRTASASAVSARRSASVKKLDEPQPGGSSRSAVPAPPTAESCGASDRSRWATVAESGAWYGTRVKLIGAIVLLAATAAHGQVVELVESAPVETTLDHADLPDAADVWPEMIDGARRTIDLAEFYVSDAPGSRLEPVIDALERRRARGVHVRLLVDELASHRTTRRRSTRCANAPGVEVRRLDVHARAGGVLHAKYFVVDGARRLPRQPELRLALAHAHPGDRRARASPRGRRRARATSSRPTGRSPAAATRRARARTGDARFPLRRLGADAASSPVDSPRGWLPDETLWELPRLVALDRRRASARARAGPHLQGGGARAPSTSSTTALRRAAARGVTSQLLVSDWCKRKGASRGCRASRVCRNVEVAPVHPGVVGRLHPLRARRPRQVPRRRRRRAPGSAPATGSATTSTTSRNVGLIIDGGRIPARLDAFFGDDWRSTYAAPVDPNAHYAPPRNH